MISNTGMWPKQFNLKSVIFLQSVKWLKNSIWLLGRTLTGTTNPGQSGPGNNGIESVIHISQSSRIDPWPSEAINCVSVDFFQLVWQGWPFLFFSPNMYFPLDSDSLYIFIFELLVGFSPYRKCYYSVSYIYIYIYIYIWVPVERNRSLCGWL